MVRAGTENLAEYRKVVNDLNVFPIPDGDTGDNMFMTCEAGIGAQPEGSLAAASEAIARGMLLGARGNSGVILSRIFAGIARGFSGIERAGAAEIASAMEAGTEEAYRAVAVPVEGTILTVYREGVRRASAHLTEESTPADFFEDLVREAEKALLRTPEQLAVLKEAGVVDSGGAGFYYIAEGMRDVLTGDWIERTGEAEAPAETAGKGPDLSLFTEESELTYGYCTEFLLRLQTKKGDPEDFPLEKERAWLENAGDSVVAFRDGSIRKVHVHTPHPGDILNHFQLYGEYLTLKIENMTLQHSESRVENRFAVKRAKKPYGIVAVASGEGLKKTFLELGCDEVVEGGQSMNPSAEDFVRAFEKTNAETILVFPNNGNVILTARQAAGLYPDSDVRVIESRTVGEGYAAVSMLDTSSGDTDGILEEMKEVIAGVVTGVVSRASREADRNGIHVGKGDFIGFSDDVIYVDDRSRETAAEKLAEALHAERYDILLVLCGADAPEEEAGRISERVRAAFRRTEVIRIDGGQPIYDYILILE